MKLIHISDLHLGKRWNHFSLLEDQDHILRQILQTIEREEAEAVLIAGDIFDKPVPPTEAVTLFDEFLVKLAERKIPVFVISGNHDSPERIAFASRLIAGSGIYLSPVYRGTVEPLILSDEYGEIAFYLLPFVKPAHVRHYFPEEKIETYTDAIRCAISHMEVDSDRRNVILSHQFVTGADRSGSEELMVGGLEQVDAAVYDKFDYAALGHIHGAQKAGKEKIRYSGTPLKYSFSEAGQKKSLTVVEIKEKGNLSVSHVPLTPLRDVQEYKGTYETLIKPEYYKTIDNDAYVHLVLTDEREVPNAFYNLRTVYPNIMQMEYDNSRTKGLTAGCQTEVEEKLLPDELFGAFYEKMNHRPLEEDEKIYVAEKIGKIWNGESE